MSSGMKRSRWDQKPDGERSGMASGNEAQSSSTCQTPPPSQTPDLFCSMLPPELRNAIYALVLTEEPSPTFTYRAPDATARSLVRLIAPVPPPITHVCRQIRYEVLGLYFATATIDKTSSYPPHRDDATLLAHPAMKMAFKFARTVNINVMLAAHIDVTDANDGFRLHRHSWARNFTVSIYRTPKAPRGLDVEVGSCGRCMCDLGVVIRRLYARSESVEDAFKKWVTWISRAMPGELGRNYQWSKVCERCGKTVPYLGPHAVSKRWDTLNSPRW